MIVLLCFSSLWIGHLCNTGSFVSTMMEAEESYNYSYPQEPLRCYNVNNETIGDYLVPIYLVMGPVLVVLCFIAFIGNSVILCTIFFIRKKHLTPTLMFSLSLAGADAVAALAMGTGVFVNNLLLVNFNVSFAYSNCIVVTVEALRLSAMVCSAFHFMILAINHWMGITKPLHYASRMTRETAGICIGVLWTLPCATFFAYFLLVENQGFRSAYCGVDTFAHEFAFRSFVAALFFAPLALMSLVYFHVFLEIGRHQKKLGHIDAQIRSSISNTERDEKRRMQSNTKALITTLIILLVYLIGWSPAVINYVLVCHDCLFPLTISLCIRLPVNIISNLLIIFKFLVDPIIYTARIQEVRTVVEYFCVKLHLRKQPLHPRSFDRIDTTGSGKGSFMTSLRYSTYRPRRESDTSRTSAQNPRSHYTASQRRSFNLEIDTNGPGSRRTSNGSIGREKAGYNNYLPYPDLVHSPLMEVNEKEFSPLAEKKNFPNNGAIGEKQCHAVDDMS